VSNARQLCLICGAAWPHKDDGWRASCAHAEVIVRWRDVDGYMDCTDIKTPIDVLAMLRTAGVWIRQLPGRPDRFWAPAWAVQVACTTTDNDRREDRARFISKINYSLQLREAAEAVALAGESVLQVLRKAVTL